MVGQKVLVRGLQREKQKGVSCSGLKLVDLKKQKKNFFLYFCVFRSTNFKPEHDTPFCFSLCKPLTRTFCPTIHKLSLVFTFANTVSNAFYNALNISINTLANSISLTISYYSALCVSFKPTFNFPKSKPLILTFYIPLGFTITLTFFSTLLLSFI
jgi:hypothetical protein